MIELERDDDNFWSDKHGLHVIVRVQRSIDDRPGFYVRDYNGGERGPFVDLTDALTVAEAAWGEVTLAPANRLRRDIEDGDEDDGMQWLVEYLAEYGTAGINAQALAQRVFERLEEE